MTSLAELEHRLEESRKQADRRLKSSTGMSQDRFQRLEDMLGEGMREGLVRFDPDTSIPGNYGTLRAVIEENGKKVTKEFIVSSDEEAAALIGLQQRANKPR